MELSSAYLYEDGNSFNIADLNKFMINNKPYNSSDPSYSFNIISGELQFTSYLAGDYYIYMQDGSATCNGVGPVKSNGVGPVKSNGVLIHVLLLVPPDWRNQG